MRLSTPASFVDRKCSPSALDHRIARRIHPALQTSSPPISLSRTIEAMERGNIERRLMELAQGSYYPWPDAPGHSTFSCAAGRRLWSVRRAAQGVDEVEQMNSQLIVSFVEAGVCVASLMVRFIRLG